MAARCAIALRAELVVDKAPEATSDESAGAGFISSFSRSGLNARFRMASARLRPASRWAAPKSRNLHRCPAPLFQTRRRRRDDACFALGLGLGLPSFGAKLGALIDGSSMPKPPPSSFGATPRAFARFSSVSSDSRPPIMALSSSDVAACAAGVNRMPARGKRSRRFSASSVFTGLGCSACSSRQRQQPEVYTWFQVLPVLQGQIAGSSSEIGLACETR